MILIIFGKITETFFENTGVERSQVQEEENQRPRLRGLLPLALHMSEPKHDGTNQIDASSPLKHLQSRRGYS